MNPAKVTMLKKQLITEGVATPEDVAKWMLDRNIKGDKETIIKTLLDRAKQSRQAVDDSLATITTATESAAAKKALQQTYDDISKIAWLEDDAATALRLLGKDKYTPLEKNQIKRILDDQYNLYTKTGDPAAWLKAKWLQTVRRELKTAIENEAEKAGIKNIKALNNETQIARGMADAIARKDSADAVREMLTAFAPTGVGGIIGSVAWPFDSNTIPWRVGNILFWMLAGRVAWSTTLKTNVASILNKLSKQEVSALDAYMKAGGKTSLPQSIVDKIDDAIKLLPPASGKATSADVVDLWIKTGYAPWILQKQEQAISSTVWKQPLTTSLLKGLSKSETPTWVSRVLPKQTPKVDIPWKKVNAPIIQKLAKKQETPKIAKIDKEMLDELDKYDNAEDFARGVLKSWTKETAWMKQAKVIRDKIEDVKMKALWLDQSSPEFAKLDKEFGKLTKELEAVDSEDALMRVIRQNDFDLEKNIETLKKFYNDNKRANLPKESKLPKKQETPKTPKTDYLNTTEAKMTDAELKSLAKKYLETSKLPVWKWRVNSDNMADYKWYARIRDYFKSQWDDSLLESKLPKTPVWVQILTKEADIKYKWDYERILKVTKEQLESNEIALKKAHNSPQSVKDTITERIGSNKREIKIAEQKLNELKANETKLPKTPTIDNEFVQALSKETTENLTTYRKTAADNIERMKSELKDVTEKLNKISQDNTLLWQAKQRTDWVKLSNTKKFLTEGLDSANDNLKSIDGILSKRNVVPKTPQVEGKTKKAQALSQKSEVKYSEPDSLTKEARKYKTADEFYKAQTDPLLELKKLGKVKKGVAEGTVTTAIDDIGGIDNVTRGTTNINKLETTETINTNSMRYKAIKEEVENWNITPIIVDDYLRVMDWHHRLAAYKAMGMTEIPVIAPKMTSGVKRTTFSEYKDIWEQANKSKSSLPMSAKSEVKYSKPENTELLDFMKKQKVINESSSIWQWKAKKIAEEYPDWFGWISNEWRALPETKEVLKNLEYYTKMLKDFNSSKTSKEFIKKLWKMNIVERMALRKSLK